MDSFTIDKAYVADLIPARRRDSHKGMNGSAGIVGGGRIYHGAPFHAAMGALRTGLDLVYLAVPSVVATPIRALSPDLIVIPLPDSKLTRGNANRLVSWLPDLGCIAVGPGLGPQNPDELTNALSRFSTKAKVMVLDADALRPQILKLSASVKVVATPHSGEFERLFGVKLEADLEPRVEAVKRAAKENAMTVLAKGPTDIVSDGERVALNTRHSPAMTVGGTGDVLTGITTGLVAKGLPGFEAACSAAYINGLAGEEAAKVHGLHIVASDVVANISAVMKQFDKLE